jgi:hypothetical protein
MKTMTEFISKSNRNIGQLHNWGKSKKGAFYVWMMSVCRLGICSVLNPADMTYMVENAKVNTTYDEDLIGIVAVLMIFMK